MTKFEKLKEIAVELKKEIDTQERLGTAQPLLIELQTKKRIMADRRCARHQATAKNCSFLTESPEDLGLDPEEQIYWDEEWLTEQSFFTHKGLAEHLELNGHNYNSETRSYIKHAFRNPEIRRVHEIISATPKLIEIMEIAPDSKCPLCLDWECDHYSRNLKESTKALKEIQKIIGE